MSERKCPEPTDTPEAPLRQRGDTTTDTPPDTAAMQPSQPAGSLEVHDLELSQAIVVHELRTPLTAVKGYAQLLDRQLKQPAPDTARLAELVDQLQRQIGRLEALLDDLPGVAPSEGDRLELSREPVDLIELARRAVARFDDAPERTPAHRLLLDVPQPPEGLIGEWDPTRLDQMLDNLISNALKYSPQGGVIRVQVRRSGTHARLAVSDQGIGIAPEARRALFRPYSRGERARLVADGSGLGLYVTSQIVNSHGGTITVSSQPGLGSTFTVWLPLTPPGSRDASA